MRYGLCCVFCKFLHILPTELFGLLCPRTVSFANHSTFLVKTRHQTWHQTWSAIRFSKFSNSCTWISGMPISWKILGFSFLLVFKGATARSKFSRSLVHKKNFSLIWEVVFKLGYIFCQAIGYLFWVWMNSEKSQGTIILGKFVNKP